MRPVDVPGAAKEVANWLHRASVSVDQLADVRYVVHHPSGIAVLICLICSRLTSTL